ncbi:MAG: hypothetical protein HQL53_13575, partial [Magnetococcales bacterium]|nr:hypothetical protein [Magnetococcales bacterium]
MLRTSLRRGGKLPYTGTVKKLLVRKKYRQNDPLPIVQVSQGLREILQLNHQGGAINLMMLFDLIALLENESVQHAAIPSKQMDWAIETLIKSDFLDKLRQELHPLEAFPLVFAPTSPSEPGRQEIITLSGRDSTDSEAVERHLDTPLDCHQVYLVHKREIDTPWLVIGLAKPLVTLQPLQNRSDEPTRWRAMLYHAHQDNTIVFRSPVGEAQHVEQVTEARNPITMLQNLLTGKITTQEHARAYPSRQSWEFTWGASESGRLQVKFYPPKAGVGVHFYLSNGQQETFRLAQAVSKEDGTTAQVSLPPGQAIVEATHRVEQDRQSTDVQITSAPVTIRRGELRTLVMALPYSMAYSEQHQKLVQSLFSLPRNMARL